MSLSPLRPTASDMASCDREPIHLLGGVQAFGFLLSLNDNWIVTRAAENTHQYLGLHPVQIIGQPLNAFLLPALVHDIRGRLQLAGGPGIVERLFGRQLTPDGALFDIAVHQSGREFILEFEPADSQAATTPAVLRAMFVRVERQGARKDMFREVVRQVRALTGFERVMIYRFNDDGAGEVVAESVRNGLPPFLGLRYPASDIPAQARALYVRNTLRLIADVNADPVPVTPVLSPGGEPIDLSMSVLRGVSPIHLEYLRNMGVRASLSISILREGKLWGLIACHDGTPRHVNLYTRSTAELFGQMFSYLLEARQRQEDTAHDEEARAIHHRIVSAFAAAEVSLEGVVAFLNGTPDYIAADGIGTYQSGKVILTGLTPTREEFLEIVRFLNKAAAGRVFSTHALSEVFPPAADYPMRAAGLLSIPISRAPRDYMVFFRQEAAKTVTWAGEPVKPEISGPNGIRLTPRKSFEAWQEIVRHQSEHWTARELRVAESLRLSLIDLVPRLADTAQTQRLQAVSHQEILVAELNHRIRNILGLVRGLIAQSAVQADDVKSLVTSLGDRIASLARAYDLLSVTQWKPASLHALLRAEIEAFDPAGQRLLLAGPDVVLQPKAFSAMALVVHEATTNARKHGALMTTNGRVLVETSTDATGNVTIVWRELGGPPVMPPTRRGFGTAILEQVIAFEVEGTSTPKYLRSGFTLDMVLPPAVAVCVEAPDAPSLAAPVQDGAPVNAASPGAAPLESLLATCLVVEDNLFIALDLEAMLRQLGAHTVDIAKSVAEALALMDQKRYSSAMLDVNLGRENSLPVARKLRESGIPFAFGTGYGEEHVLRSAFADVPIIAKPYHPERLAAVLTRMTGTNPPDGAAP